MQAMIGSSPFSRMTGSSSPGLSNNADFFRGAVSGVPIWGDGTATTETSGQRSPLASVVETPSPRRRNPNDGDDSSKITPPKLNASPPPSPRHATKRADTPQRPESIPKSPTPPSPRRRLRAKMPLPQNEDISQAIVAVPLTPAKRALAGGPAPSFGRLLKRLDDPSLVPMAPLKKPRSAKWMQEVRGTALFEVPASATQGMPEVGSPTHPRRYPRRSTRIPPLEFWRGEHLVYTRDSTSEAPSVTKVVYNCARRAEDLPERAVPLKGTAILGEGTVEAEFNLAESAAVSSKFIVLPPWQRGRANPPTYVVPASSIGLVYVTDGSLRYTVEGENDLAVLNVGDALKLAGSSRDVLLASAGECGTSTCAKFRAIFVKGGTEAPPPLTL